MLPLLNRAIAQSLPLVPRPVVGRVARRYIAGDSLDDALRSVRALRDQGFHATCDVLGEDVTEREQTGAVVEEYVQLIDALTAERLPSGVSLKLTQLGLRLDPELAVENLRRIVTRAQGRGAFVRVDMEDSSLTDVTLAIVRSFRDAGFRNVGAVVQAYLFRSDRDIEALVREDSDVRLCKGIYREPEDVAYQDRALVSASYLRLARRLLLSGTRVGLATHDLHIIAELRAFLRERQIPRETYEFQALLGVPIGRTLRSLADEGHRVRLYVPYGTHWYAYSVRRLKENPDVAGHVLRSMFSRQA